MAKRIEFNKTVSPKGVQTLAGSTPVKVVATTDGPVTWQQKVKEYYKGLIALLGAVLIFFNEVTPITNFLPADYRHWVTIIVTFLTAAGTFLKSNQHWVDDL